MDDEENDAKRKAEMLEKVMAEINATYGKGSIRKLSDKPIAMECTSSGCLTLDVALGGGYPKGRIIEIFGPESSGKTTLALHAIAEVNKKGGMATFVDAEHAFDVEYAKRLGVDVDRLLVTQPDNGEMALEVVDRMARSHSVDLVVVDSVAALLPRAELEGEMGSTQVGAQARLMSTGLRKLAATAAKSKCTVIFLNQIRMKVGVLFGSPETTSGGQALKFYASCRIDIRSKEKIQGEGEQTGVKVKAKVIKNKVAPPFREAWFDIMFGTGIDSAGCLLDSAETLKVVARRGAYYYMGETRLGQGRDAVLRMLIDEPDKRAALEELTKAALKSQQQSTSAPEEDEAPGEEEQEPEVDGEM